jgi:hypothetical protein
MRATTLPQIFIPFPPFAQSFFKESSVFSIFTAAILQASFSLFSFFPFPSSEFAKSPKPFCFLLLLHFQCLLHSPIAFPFPLVGIRELVLAPKFRPPVLLPLPPPAFPPNPSPPTCCFTPTPCCFSKIVKN